MGYSCGALAGLVHDGMTTQLQASGVDQNCQNLWERQGKVYMDERGRENEDGAITGTVFELTPDPAKPGHFSASRRVGSYRIEASGKVTRFPTSTLANRQTAENAGRLKFIEQFNLDMLLHNDQLHGLKSEAQTIH